MLYEHLALLRDGSDLRMTNITSDLDPEIWSSDLVVETSRPQMETLDPGMVVISSMVLILGIPEMVHGESPCTRCI